MPTPTYIGFLRAYTRALSLGKEHGVVAMAIEASATNRRLKEPLLCLAVETHCVPLLLESCDEGLRKEYEKVLSMYGECNFSNAVRDDGSRIPNSYKKIWADYVAQRDSCIAESDEKTTARQQIMALIADSGITVPQISAACSAQKSNVYAWIRHGENGRVSLELARRLLCAALTLKK
jgi:hypothetical protein